VNSTQLAWSSCSLLLLLGILLLVVLLLGILHPDILLLATGSLGGRGHITNATTTCADIWQLLVLVDDQLCLLGENAPAQVVEVLGQGGLLVIAVLIRDGVVVWREQHHINSIQAVFTAFQLSKNLICVETDGPERSFKNI
jgi:hypothetical protein